MPNRLLRDTTDSEAINSLSSQAEVLFYRLIMKADDFGSFHANPKMIKSLLFPLKTDSIRDADITRWIAECEKSGLIVVYKSGHKDYLRIINFGQRLRNMRNKFPDPPSDISQQVAASRSKSPPEEEVEEENEVEVDVEPPPRQQQKISENDSLLFQMFKNCSNWKTDLILQEIGKFKNKYPDLPTNKSGPVVNKWVANYKPVEQADQKEKPRPVYNFSQNGMPGKK